MLDRGKPSRIEMPLTALLAAVSGVARNDDEAFDLLESILDEGWVAIVPERRVADAGGSVRRSSPPFISPDRHRLDRSALRRRTK